MDWAEAKTLYETKPGTTFVELAEGLGCTHQNVSKKARKEGWIKPDNSVVAVAEQMSVSQPTQGSKLGVRSPENLAQVINVFGVSGKKSLAAGTIGITVETLKQWCLESPELLEEMSAARKRELAKHYQNISNAGVRDWKASKEVLARDPLTKADWGEVQKEGPTIVLNIVRD